MGQKDEEKTVERMEWGRQRVVLHMHPINNQLVLFINEVLIEIGDRACQVLVWRAENKA